MAALVASHPGHDHSKELNARLEFLANNKNDLSHCAEKMRARGLDAANSRRRSELAGQLMKKRGLEGENDWSDEIFRGRLLLTFDQFATFRRTPTATSRAPNTQPRPTWRPSLLATARAP